MCVVSYDPLSRAPKFRALQARKRHININFLLRLALGRPWVCPRDEPEFVPGTHSVVPGTNQGFSLFAQWKPSSSQGQTQFVPRTNPGRRVTIKVYVVKVYVPSSLAIAQPGLSRSDGSHPQREGTDLMCLFLYGWSLFRFKTRSLRGWDLQDLKLKEMPSVKIWPCSPTQRTLSY